MEEKPVIKPKLSAAEQIGQSFDEALRRKEINVIVKDLDISLFSLIFLLVKVAIAIIPAGLILLFLLTVLTALIPGLRNFLG